MSIYNEIKINHVFVEGIESIVINFIIKNADIEYKQSLMK